MDAKLSSFPLASTLLSTDVIPVITSGANKTITGGVLSLNLPNIGNRGITKNAVLEASVISLPLTSTLISLPELIQPYTLGNGTDGQEIMIVSKGVNVVNIASGTISSATMMLGSTISLVFIGSLSKWVVKGTHNSILA
jgi:hypothetical protein